MSIKDRVLSEFMAREMIVDYVLGHLEMGEAKAFDRAVEENFHLKDEIRRLEGALAYCKKLSAIPVVEEPLQSLARGSFSRGKEWALEEWSSPKLRLGVASVLFCVLGATVYLSLPSSLKEKLIPSQITLFEVKKSIDAPKDKIAFIGPRLPEDQPEAPKTTQQPEVTAGGKPPLPVGATPPNLVANSTPTPVPAPPLPTQAQVLAAQNAAEPAELESELGPSGKFKGVVFRAFTFTSQIDTVSPQIKDKILALGGAKAGEVDLGWKKRGGRYFHFTLPQSSYDELIATIQAYGPVRIQKDPHPRVMPEGQIRFILWLEDRGRNDITPADGSKPEQQQPTAPEIAP
ncbi:MAG: hypothetical protein K2X47_12575 [Bdellovibrionales bacterium]|nr:hypothetical protein [Bdellovibrionales bacterium]